MVGTFWRQTAVIADFLLNSFATMLVTIDPIGLAPIFLAVTRGADPKIRRIIAVRASIIAALILIAFAFIGSGILSFLGISLPAFRIAGGLLLFWIAFEMVFEKRERRKQASAEQALGHDKVDAAAAPRQHGPSNDDYRSLAVFPLAIPLIAGPGAISATILIGSQTRGVADQAALVGLLLGMTLLCFMVFIAADKLDRFLGETGRTVLTRLLGVLLAALAVQFVADGAKAIFM
ncbi:MarC family protein [Oryzibacter oryziterrae]|uniref:MarC family protein n=1 Tax=Oryzibacter oryziterrae TaxID=2766474 RepID=UPI001F2F03E1|nr:MarC family protein [Oryzibacter oryziterrae]